MYSYYVRCMWNVGQFKFKLDQFANCNSIILQARPLYVCMSTQCTHSTCEPLSSGDPTLPTADIDFEKPLASLIYDVISTQTLFKW